MIYPEELERMGIALTPNGRLKAYGQPYHTEGLIVLWRTDQADSTNKHIYEGDICEIEIQKGEEMVVRIGRMHYDPMAHQFTVAFNGKGQFVGAVRITKCTVIGNEYQDSGALARYNSDNGEK
jgi:hypothetical protein